MTTVMERGEEAPVTTAGLEVATPARLTTTLYDLMAVVQDFGNEPRLFGVNHEDASAVEVVTEEKFGQGQFGRHDGNVFRHDAIKDRDPRRRQCQRKFQHRRSLAPVRGRFPGVRKQRSFRSSGRRGRHRIRRWAVHTWQAGSGSHGRHSADTGVPR